MRRITIKRARTWHYRKMRRGEMSGSALGEQERQRVLATIPLEAIPKYQDLSFTAILLLAVYVPPFAEAGAPVGCDHSNCRDAGRLPQHSECYTRMTVSPVTAR